MTLLAGADNKYKTMTKYTFYESGEKYIKVSLDFPDAKKLIKESDIKANFQIRSFEIFVHNYKE